MWKVAIVDDEPKIRRGLKKWILDKSKCFECSFEAKSGEECLKNKQGMMVDLYLLDIHMEGLNGLDLGKLIKRENPNALIVYITGYDYFEYAHEAIKLQAFDYLLKPVPQSDFFKLLKKANIALRDIYPERQIQRNEPIKDKCGGCSQVVLQGKEYIKENYSDPNLSLEKAAKILNVHKDYLSKLMKEESGYSFTEYLTKIRVNSAKELLEQDLTNVRMYDVARKIGYKSQHYFSRTFKKNVGLTPLQYRKEKCNLLDWELF
ncbi:response regulator transcription factor [Tindallia californiensis]|uniref:Stage 0 sporulation protein A homolog n=1 Tax=Tindallia californiensis TaxID=159292 RepID=A0A1H3IRY3_9FIRM|nr:response regulator [Tindallia californiensis]SDY29614.1 Helix-turn-helix domain-containing protein [Tindallia californiensis]